MEIKEKEQEKEQLCNARCKTCIHRTNLPAPPHNVGCMYLLHTYRRRPCPPGNECTEYIKGKSMDEKHQIDFGRAVSGADSKITKKCVRCGKTYEGGRKQKYCDECFKRKQYDRSMAYDRKRAEKKKEEQMLVDKVCTLCGNIYHSPSNRIGYCSDCKSLSRHAQRKLRGIRDAERRS